MATGYIYDPIYLAHADPHYDHVEAPRRLQRIVEVLGERDALFGLTQVEAVPIEHDVLTAVHHPEYVQRVQVVGRNSGRLDAETYVGSRSHEAALRAAGGIVQAVEAVLNGNLRRVLALVRPPGHHAFPGHGEGFCLFNNVAVAARYATDVRGLERVLVVDWDVHHGNGTQAIFSHDPRVFYFSTHQGSLYPGTGRWTEVGEGAGTGTTCNVPLPAYVGDEGYARVFENLLYPLAERYQPQLVLVSAGFDGHWLDPLASMGLSIHGYSRLCQTIKAIASDLCDGRLVLALEGGYHLDALAGSILACLHVLTGEARAVKDPLGRSAYPEPPIHDLITQLQGLHRLY